jgi:hypothetical protein
LAFEAALGSDEESGMPAPAKFAGDCERRDDVTAGTAAREQESEGVADATGATVAGGWWLVAGV